MKLSFTQRLINWQREYGRHHLPWQVMNPYCVWLSEIMLQQTQVATVLDYYPRFLQAFPDVYALANAQQDEVLSLWAGLGYYSRARNLHKAAQQVVSEFGGEFPQQRLQLEKLVGVGRSTAAAIAAFAFQQREAILDGNVKRVLCRVFALDGELNDRVFEQSLWQLAEELLPINHNDMPTYTQGLMDLGATVCKRSKPSCEICPMEDICQAKAQQRVDALPRKKQKISVQQQDIYWLVLRRNNGDICLHKRAEKDIWAGLYCVPSFECEQDLVAWLANYPLNSFQAKYVYQAIQHRLTHRLLNIIPIEYCVLDSFRLPESCIWVNIENSQEYGLPKPLATFLKKQRIQLSLLETC